jgi:hypothetical protein
MKITPVSLPLGAGHAEARGVRDGAALTARGGVAGTGAWRGIAADDPGQEVRVLRIYIP